MKRPSYQWYPGDWKRDPGLQAASFEARALWREMLDLMHDGNPYGHLTAPNGLPLTAKELASSCRISAARVHRYLEELEKWGVFSRTESGVIYSRRMVKDEALRQTRAECGKLGGNPKLGRKVKDLDNQRSKQKPTPSVAVSSSSSQPPGPPSPVANGGETRGGEPTAAAEVMAKVMDELKPRLVG